MTWEALRTELDLWHAAGEKATLWWRDDGVADWTPALYRLIRVAEAGPVPLALSVAPMNADPRLAARLKRESRVRVLQHGYALRNNAGADALPSEYPPGRAKNALVGEICAGWLRMSELFGRQALSVFVPPWNRMGEALPDALAALGFKGVSTFGPRPRLKAEDSIVTVNAHVDPLTWGDSPRFGGEAAVLNALIGHLKARREGPADFNEPTGLLTQHLDLDEAAWAFLEGLVAATANHPAVRWVAPEVVFTKSERIGAYIRPLSPTSG
jgi:hypothetical protein